MPPPPLRYQHAHDSPLLPLGVCRRVVSRYKSNIRLAMPSNRSLVASQVGITCAMSR